MTNTATQCYLHQVSAICALGPDIANINEKLFSVEQSPLTMTDAYSPGRHLPLGLVADLPLTADTRNNSLLSEALEPLRAQIELLKTRFGAERIGVILGSSTSGITEGEAAALIILSREPGPVRLAGVGETSDAHHISAPDPEGKGAAAAMSLALKSANLQASKIGYVNLHGTATEQNDRMESIAVAQILGADVPCGSTKSLTGHTLGAAGALEAVFCYLALMRKDKLLPRQIWDGETDPQLAALTQLGAQSSQQHLGYAMSNSFAFGGNNISLILERCDE